MTFILCFDFSEIVLILSHWHQLPNSGVFCFLGFFYPFQAQLQREKEQDHMKLQAKLEKLDVLEKECFKLTATQKTAEVSFHLFL